MSWGVLYSGESPQAEESANSTMPQDISYCGKHDCQAPEITERNIDQYEPGSEAAFYGVVGGMTALVFISILISIFTIPEIDETKEYSENDEEADSFITVAQTKDGVVVVDRKEPNKPPPKKVK